MKRSKYILTLTLMIMGMSLLSCNKSLNSDAEPGDFGSVQVTGFSLKADKAILNNLDSVFFSIDLVSAQIFNADSLPKDTDVSALAVTLSTSTCSEVKFYVPQESGADKVVDYLADGDAKIDFSRGAVRLRLVSLDGENHRDYFVKVNVHDMVADSLYWDQAAVAKYPTTLANPTSQKSLLKDGKIYCLATDGTNYTIGVTDNPYDNQWEVTSVSFPEKVDVRSLTATTDAFYVLGESGALLVSADAKSWSATAENWQQIVAPYESRLLGLKAVDGELMHVDYPTMRSWAAGADFPIKGMSAAAEFSTKWAVNPQIMMVGGVMSNGECCGATWAFDGKDWAKLSEGLPKGDGYAMTKYIICETDTISWRVRESEVMIAMGGRIPGVEAKNEMYFSRDLGITWKRADDLLQPGEWLPSAYNADLLVAPHLMTESTDAGKGWAPIKLYMPPWLLEAPGSRATKPITQWECQFLYLFGAETDGGMSDNVYRGVINHFTFKPLQ